MTESLGRPDLSDMLQGFARRAGRMLGKLGFGVLLVVALVIALVATTFIGLLLALAALFLTFALKRPPARPPASGGTLEAHRTPDGWVTESGSSSWR
jgi:hypothetical protein